MAVSVVEAVESRSVDGSNKAKTLTKIFIVSGEDGGLDMGDPLQAWEMGPTFNEQFGDLMLTNKRAEPMMINQTLVPGTSRLICTYQRPQQDETDPGIENEIAWDTTAQMTHIIKAIAQAHIPDTANTGLLIGADLDEVEGVDIYEPKGAYSETKTLITLDNPDMRDLMAQTATTNDATWKGWARGQALFLGATGHKRGRDNWLLTYRFLMQENKFLTIQTVNGEKSFIKLGWEYLWFSKTKGVIGGVPLNYRNEQTIQHNIESIHLAQVYNESNFAALGLGV